MGAKLAINCLFTNTCFHEQNFVHILIILKPSLSTFVMARSVLCDEAINRIDGFVVLRTYRNEDGGCLARCITCSNPAAGWCPSDNPGRGIEIRRQNIIIGRGNTMCRCRNNSNYSIRHTE